MLCLKEHFNLEFYSFRIPNFHAFDESLFVRTNCCKSNLGVIWHSHFIITNRDILTERSKMKTTLLKFKKKGMSYFISTTWCTTGTRSIRWTLKKYAWKFYLIKKIQNMLIQSRIFGNNQDFGNIYFQCQTVVS